MKEHSLQSALLRTLGRDRRLRIWRQNTGVARYRDRVVRFGLPGQADLSGITDRGVRVEIEVKSPNGRLSKQQEAFGRMIQTMGGIYIVARSVQQTLEELEPWLNPKQ